MSFNDIRVYKLFDAELIPASTTVVATAVDLGNMAQNGYVSVQVDMRTAANGCSISATYELSNTGVSYVEPTGIANIFSSFGNASGVRQDGADMFSVSLMLARFMRVKVWEINGTGGTLTMDLAVQ